MAKRVAVCGNSRSSWSRGDHEHRAFFEYRRQANARSDLHAENHESQSMTSPKAEKSRLDVLLVERGLAPSRERAQALIMAGQVQVAGQRIDKPGTRIATDARVEIIGQAAALCEPRWVEARRRARGLWRYARGKNLSRCGQLHRGLYRLPAAAGAAKVYAVDVTIDQLDWKLQQDRASCTIERNARHLRAADIADPVALDHGRPVVHIGDQGASRARIRRGARRRFADSDQAAIRAGKT